MRKITIAFFVMLIVISCNSNKNEEKTVIVDSVSIPVKPDSAKVITDSHYFWTTDLDQKKGLLMKKVSPVSSDSLTYQNMIAFVNMEFPEAKLSFVKISGDSIYVKIGNSKFVTQQMGSSGAEAYLAEVTYNLTELKNIGFVNINFKEGDHAQPGTYSRTDFVFEQK